MIDYMLPLPGIRDMKMEDGTSAFTMALAGHNIEAMQMLLALRHQSDIDPVQLLLKAVMELDTHSDDPSGSKFRDELAILLEERGIPCKTQSGSLDSE